MSEEEIARKMLNQFIMVLGHYEILLTNKFHPLNELDLEHIRTGISSIGKSLEEPIMVLLESESNTWSQSEFMFSIKSIHLVNNEMLPIYKATHNLEQLKHAATQLKKAALAFI